jgi:dienelactone hydrolase
LSAGVSEPKIKLATASTAAGVTVLFALGFTFGGSVTVTSAAKPEVSFDGSVAVALTESPFGTEY